MNEENENEPIENHRGVIHDVGVLDLRYAKSPEELRKIKGIHDVGVIIVSEEAASALTEMSINDVGSIVALPSNVPVNCLTGQIKLTGDALKGGDPETILVVVGQAFITTTVTEIGYKEIRIVGQLLAPRDSQQALSSKLTQVRGQVLYGPAGSRQVMGSDTFDQEFLELLPEPTPFIVMGSLTFADDVTKEILKEKIPEIVLLGTISAKKELVSLLNVITPEKMGNIAGR